jgi:hypothetical protein
MAAVPWHHSSFCRTQSRKDRKAVLLASGDDDPQLGDEILVPRRR